MYLFFIGGPLLYNTVLVSAIHQHEPVIGAQTSPSPEPPSLLSPLATPLGCLRAAGLSSLHHMVNSHWLSALHIVCFTHGGVWDPVDCSPPGSPVSRILQVGILELHRVRRVFPGYSQPSHPLLPSLRLHSALCITSGWPRLWPEPWIGGFLPLSAPVFLGPLPTPQPNAPKARMPGRGVRGVWSWESPVCCHC